MASTSTIITEELLGHIPMLNAFQIRRLVLYLSPDDATTIETFENSELADSYYVETINLRYGKLENKNTYLMCLPIIVDMKIAPMLGWIC